jgi:hypothetical protein
MSDLLFPLGHDSGVRPGAEQDVHVVRLGRQQHRISEDAYGIWALAHGLPDGGKRRWTANDVVRAADRNQIPDGRARLHELIGAGLVVPVRDETAFVAAHRVDPLMVGLGNSPEQLDAHAVGVPGLGTAAVLDPSTYDLWQQSPLMPTLWHSCERRASSAAAFGQYLPAAAIAGVLADLRYLLAHGCAYLDVAAVS